MPDVPGYSSFTSLMENLINMKTHWVATLNAGTFKVNYWDVKKILGAVLFVLLALLVISCTNSDDSGMIENDVSIDEEIPVDNEPPVDNESAVEQVSLIIHYDIEPDFTSENLNTFYELDINNDQIIDFTLGSATYDNLDYLMMGSNPTVGNSLLSVSPWYSHPVPLPGGQIIFHTGHYTNGEHYVSGVNFTIGDCFGGESDCFYNWQLKEDKYLGLSFKINGQTHFGWVKMYIVSAAQWVIMEYAYNATANRPIRAGQRE